MAILDSRTKNRHSGSPIFDHHACTNYNTILFAHLACDIAPIKHVDQPWQ